MRWAPERSQARSSATAPRIAGSLIRFERMILSAKGRTVWPRMSTVAASFIASISSGRLALRLPLIRRLIRSSSRTER